MNSGPPGPGTETLQNELAEQVDMRRKAKGGGEEIQFGMFVPSCQDKHVCPPAPPPKKVV